MNENKRFHWEQIYTTPHTNDNLYFESTFRAKVIGGWLIKHTTLSDYKYMLGDDDPDDDNFIDNEGFKEINNVITFISDPKHEWTIGY